MGNTSRPLDPGSIRSEDGRPPHVRSRWRPPAKRVRVRALVAGLRLAGAGGALYLAPAASTPGVTHQVPEDGWFDLEMPGLTASGASR